MRTTGVLLMGIGMSLVFPVFGLIAVQRVNIANRGITMAAYNVFFDIGEGFAAPAVGLKAAWGSYRNIYAVAAATATLSTILAYQELKHKVKDRN